MTLRLNGSITGYTEIDAPQNAGNNTLVLPTSNGTAGNILGTDGSGNLSWVNGRMVQGTSQASTSGTAIDFTGIPSWAKRVTVMFNGVSTNGTSATQVQLGSTTFSTTGYSSSAGAINSGTGQLGSTTGLLLSQGIPAASFISGSIFISLLASNVWVYSGTTLYSSTSGAIHVLGGNSPTLSGTLDRIRITTVNGTDTFDAGSINILYEG